MSLASSVAGARPRPAPSDGRPRLSWVKVAIFSMLPVLVLLGAAEVGLRVWAYWFRTPYERYNVRSGRLELVPNIYHTTAGGREFRINSRGFLGPEFVARRAPGVYRIVAVG